jgi:hypothetical protein
LVENGRLREHYTIRRFVMIVTVFRSRLRPGAREEYTALVDRMVELAKTMPGYISHKGFLPKTASALPLSNSSTKRGCVPGA